MDIVDTVGPQSNLGRPRGDSEGALPVATTGELYRETNKMCAWGKDDFLGHRLGEGAIGLQDESVEKVQAFPSLAGHYTHTAISASLSDLVRKRYSNSVT
ncbi:hypothetical protein PoB_006035100 [Plakobranchus ocellatus]|uniref:Uncharacterized protein n=1 Tax=Plakobranchus ocellatus TaxID=259542 RepID=A0AAV4CPR4_9GAST|nr:hypothetical protein PoB_006035100 [Plakobranchus ocellatus]